MSVRVADRNDKLLPTVNGGPTDSRTIFNFGTGVTGTQVESSAQSYGVPVDCLDNGALLCNKNGPTRADGAYGGSINTDDSRLIGTAEI